MQRLEQKVQAFSWEGVTSPTGVQVWGLQERLSLKGASEGSSGGGGGMSPTCSNQPSLLRLPSICLPNAAGFPGLAQQKQGNGNFKIEAWAKKENSVLFF